MDGLVRMARPARLLFQVTMDVEYGVSGTLSASHSRCPGWDWPHGHVWEILVLVTGEIDPATGRPRGSDGLGNALTQLIATLRNQDLDKALPGATTLSAAGVAMAIMGELVARFPRLTEVTVVDEESAECGRVRRTPRVL